MKEVGQLIAGAMVVAMFALALLLAIVRRRSEYLAVVFTYSLIALGLVGTIGVVLALA